jgi:hypothetical protein
VASGNGQILSSRGDEGEFLPFPRSLTRSQQQCLPIQGRAAAWTLSCSLRRPARRVVPFASFLFPPFPVVANLPPLTTIHDSSHSSVPPPLPRLVAVVAHSLRRRRASFARVASKGAANLRFQLGVLHPFAALRTVGQRSANLLLVLRFRIGEREAVAFLRSFLPSLSLPLSLSAT